MDIQQVATNLFQNSEYGQIVEKIQSGDVSALLPEEMQTVQEILQNAGLEASQENLQSLFDTVQNLSPENVTDQVSEISESAGDGILDKIKDFFSGLFK